MYVRFETRRKAVKLHLEQGTPILLVAKEVGVAKGTVMRWVKRYWERGEEGLRTVNHAQSRDQRNGGLTGLQEKIVEVKQANPGFGVTRISQFLKRMMFVPASAETVRRTLTAQQLMPVIKKRARPMKRGEYGDMYAARHLWVDVVAVPVTALSGEACQGCEGEAWCKAR